MKLPSQTVSIEIYCKRKQNDGKKQTDSKMKCVDQFKRKIYIILSRNKQEKRGTLTIEKIMKTRQKKIFKEKIRIRSKLNTFNKLPKSQISYCDRKEGRKILWSLWIGKKQTGTLVFLQLIKHICNHIFGILKYKLQ